jgi:hypothetical protein
MIAIATLLTQWHGIQFWSGFAGATGQSQNQWAVAHGLKRKQLSLIRHHHARSIEEREVASLETMRRVAAALGLLPQHSSQQEPRP